MTFDAGRPTGRRLRLLPSFARRSRVAQLAAGALAGASPDPTGFRLARRRTRQRERRPGRDHGRARGQSEPSGTDPLHHARGRRPVQRAVRCDGVDATDDFTSVKGELDFRPGQRARASRCRSSTTACRASEDDPGVAVRTLADRHELPEQGGAHDPRTTTRSTPRDSANPLALAYCASPGNPLGRRELLRRSRRARRRTRRCRIRRST